MITRTTLLFLVITSFQPLIAQPGMEYYFPNVSSWNPAISTPANMFGFDIGEWHLSHDQIDRYIHQLASESDRISLHTYARSFERRPLSVMIITDPANHDRLSEIKDQRQQWCDPGQSGRLSENQLPVILYQGYSIHGNEASGANAAILYAYYLAASKDPFVSNALSNSVILLDPAMNPDGINRFASWVNGHRNITAQTDKNEDREHIEAWPRARTNHYWFDLNRDWLPVQMPESRGRVALFQEWRPNILTDHHEMGTNNTYFFQPGIPSRTNPLTSATNQEITGKIATYHARALDRIGSLYYTRESFDDFYYGKGSTYPDVNGCIGILFEQASARGHSQESSNGILTFPFTIRNQLTTSLSTLEAAVEMKSELLEYQRNFFRDAMQDARKEKFKAFVVSDDGDPYRMQSFCDMLQIHEIEYYSLERELDDEFQKNSSILIPLEQNRFRTVQAMFQTLTAFRDSLFYDISSWTLPVAYGLPYRQVSPKEYNRKLLGMNTYSAPISGTPSSPAYLYAIPWDQYQSPRLVFALLQEGIRLKVATKSFAALDDGKPRYWPVGTILVGNQNQNRGRVGLFSLLSELSRSHGLPFSALDSGLSVEGVDMGSPSMKTLREPKIMLVCGDGVSSYQAGEIWHMLDQRFSLPITKVEGKELSATAISGFNTIIFPHGWYSSVSKSAITSIREWVSKGGTLIFQRGAIPWAVANKLATLKTRNSKKKKQEGRRSYEDISKNAGAKVVGGFIARARIDLSNPIFYGYHDSTINIFKRGKEIYELPANPFASPMIYDDKPILSGYLHPVYEKDMAGSAGVVLNRIGRGRIINFADNHQFRAFWYGTNKMMMNAIFFGHLIDGSAAETVPAGKNPGGTK